MSFGFSKSSFGFAWRHCGQRLWEECRFESQDSQSQEVLTNKGIRILINKFWFIASQKQHELVIVRINAINSHRGELAIASMRNPNFIHKSASQLSPHSSSLYSPNQVMQNPTLTLKFYAESRDTVSFLRPRLVRIFVGAHVHPLIFSSATSRVPPPIFRFFWLNFRESWNQYKSCRFGNYSSVKHSNPIQSFLTKKNQPKPIKMKLVIFVSSLQFKVCWSGLEKASVSWQPHWKPNNHISCLTTTSAASQSHLLPNNHISCLTKTLIAWKAHYLFNNHIGCFTTTPQKVEWKWN